MKHVAVYMRVSTDSQSTDSQESELRKYLTDRGLDPDDRSRVVWYVDTISGDKINRTELSLLRKRAKDGAVSEVVCWKIDRLSRTMLDGINLICEWLDSGIAVISITQQFDFRGPIGKAVAALLLALAEAELQNIRERIKAGIQRAKKAGKKWGGAPKGRRTKKLRGKTNAIHRMWLQGIPVRHIAKIVGVTRQTIHNMAKDLKWKTDERAKGQALRKQLIQIGQMQDGDQRRSNEIINLVADSILEPEDADGRDS